MCRRHLKWLSICGVSHWIPGPLDTRNHMDPEPLDPWTLNPWIPGSLDPWTPGTPGPWTPGHQYNLNITLSSNLTYITNLNIWGRRAAQNLKCRNWKIINVKQSKTRSTGLSSYNSNWPFSKLQACPIDNGTLWTFIWSITWKISLFYSLENCFIPTNISILFL